MATTKNERRKLSEHARMILAVLMWFVGPEQRWQIQVLPDCECK